MYSVDELGLNKRASKYHRCLNSVLTQERVIALAPPKVPKIFELFGDRSGQLGGDGRARKWRARAISAASRQKTGLRSTSVRTSQGACITVHPVGKYVYPLDLPESVSYSATCHSIGWNLLRATRLACRSCRNLLARFRRHCRDLHRWGRTRSNMLRWVCRNPITLRWEICFYGRLAIGNKIDVRYELCINNCNGYSINYLKELRKNSKVFLILQWLLD